jgi:hypothetical protein
MSARFKVDSRGQLAPETSEGAQLLATRAGTFSLVPTSPDLLCFVRGPAQGGRISAPRVVLTGDAGGFALSDLIAFLGQSRWTGMIRVHTPNGERTLTLKEGEVRGATSDDPADRLGEVMVRMGYVDRAKLDEALHENPPSKVGRALVEKGVLQSHDLWKCLTHQVSEIFHAVVLCREGVFLLVDQEPDDKQHTLQLSTQSLLMDSVRKIDEMAHFRKRIPHGRLYVGWRRASDGKLEEDEDRVLSLMSGQRTVLELGQAAKLSEFDVTKIIFRLLEGGYAQISEKPLGAGAAQEASRERDDRAPRAAGKSYDPHVIIHVFNSIFREIRDEVARKGMEKEFVAAANAAIAGEALSSSPVLLGLSFDPAGNLPADRLEEQFERCREQLGSEPAASLKKALSDVMFFLLFQAGELLESRADEDLARRVKELLAHLEQG